jgi:DNA polymerase-3 subunit gamma/tau
VAAQFSEEDLARFLQIMLRTHDEIGYRQEQRFHLELGLLKLVHAQRILPLEQIMSGIVKDATNDAGSAAAGKSGASAPIRQSVAPQAVSRPQTPAGASTPVPAPRKQEPFTSPFEADRARKSRGFDPEMADAVKIESQSASPSSPVATSVIGAGIAVAIAEDPQLVPVAAALETSGDPAVILGEVLSALENGGHKMLASILEQGEVALQGDELKITLSQSAAVIDVMMSAEPKRLANAAAARAAGRQIKVNVVGGATARNGVAAPVARPARNGAGARSRAADDPIVRRMQEKFGAEIRTVIDHREKT